MSAQPHRPRLGAEAPRRRAPWGAAGLALTFVLTFATGCRRAPETTLAAWQRFDLWRAPARVEGGGEKSLVRGTAYLGPSEVRPAARLAALSARGGELRVDHLAAGEILALRQARGTQATWRLSLGREPFLSFIPLAESGRPCTCRMRIEVSAEGGESGAPVSVWEGEPRVPEPFAPATVSVDLGRFAGRPVDLTLRVEAQPGAAGRRGAGRALWGSPAAYFREEAAPPAGTSSRPNILLIGIDTLRADALGAYGRSPSLTPALDRLAGESDVWLDAYSCFNVTNPSFASLLTGLYGKDHGVYDFDTPLAPERSTLAEVLSQAGYDTRAILSIDHLRDAQSGLAQGFGEFSEAREQRAGESAVDLALDWIAARRRPFFLWLHLFDPHTPHTPPQPFASGLRPKEASGLGFPMGWSPFRPAGPVPYRNAILGGAKELYDGEVAYTDRQVDRLLGFLRSRGLLESTIVVMVADHGENLEDHGVSYRHSGLWDTTTHVPLMIRWPESGGRGRRLAGLVQNVDLFPTLLGAAGLPVPPQDGTDLRTLTGGKGRGRRAVFAEHTGQLGAMVRTLRYKYMTSRGNRLVPDGSYLYDLASDPGEQRNLAGRGLAAEKDLDALLRRWLSVRRAPQKPTVDAQPLSAEEIARLRALGYQ